MNNIHDWEKLARDAGYSVAALAKGCEVSRRQLERYFQKTMGRTPSHWINQLWSADALKRLSEGQSVKEIAIDLNYGHLDNFSRDFKKLLGFPPSRVLQMNAKRANRITPESGKMTFA